MENLNLSEILNLLAVLAVAAAVAGFMAGLLGVGGGIIMVPALYYAFTVLDFDILTRMHLSVGTSLAIIIPTSIISTKTHMEYDAVDFKMVKSFGVFILIGVILGTFLAVNLSTPPLVLFFSIFAFMVGLFFIFLREKLVENPKTISIMIKNISGVVIGEFFSEWVRLILVKSIKNPITAIESSCVRFSNDLGRVKAVLQSLRIWRITERFDYAATGEWIWGERRWAFFKISCQVFVVFHVELKFLQARWAVIPRVAN